MQRRLTLALLAAAFVTCAAPALATPLTWDWEFALHDDPGDAFNTVAPNAPIHVVLTFDPAANACSTFGRGFFDPTGYAVYGGKRYDLWAAGIEVNNALGNECGRPDSRFVAGQPTEYVFRLFGLPNLSENYLDPDSPLVGISYSVINFSAPFNGSTIDPDLLRLAALSSVLEMRTMSGDPMNAATGNTVSIDLVPEPSTWLLLGSGLVGTIRRRRSRALTPTPPSTAPAA